MSASRSTARPARTRARSGAPLQPAAHDLQAPSATGAMSDVYEFRREELGKLDEPIGGHEGQIGAVCVIDGEISILDLVGRADVWADLHPALVERLRARRARADPGSAGRGEHAPRPPRRRWIHEFIGRATAAPASAEHRRHEAGLGSTVRFADLGVAGTATVVADEGLDRGEELVQLTAYPDPAGPRLGRRPPERPRVRRPSQRRGGSLD